MVEVALGSEHGKAGLLLVCCAVTWAKERCPLPLQSLAAYGRQKS